MSYVLALGLQNNKNIFEHSKQVVQTAEQILSNILF